MTTPDVVPLDSLDGTKLGAFIGAGFVAMIVPMVGMVLVGESLAPPLRSLAPFLGLGAGVLANAVLLLFGRRAVYVRRFVLRFGPDRLDLLTATGQPVASSADGSLSVAPVNYVRRTKRGASSKAGVRLRGGPHDLLVAGLHPDPAWPQAETDPRAPAFELEVGPFEALKRAAS